MLSEHPIAIIEKLLKLGMGDKGRLLYLRNHLKNGKPIYDSDRKFLEKMCAELEETKSEKPEKLDNFPLDDAKKNTFALSEPDVSKSGETRSIDNKRHPSRFDPEIIRIETLIGDLKKSDSKLKDNLELFLMSREVSSQQKTEKPNSYKSISNIAITKAPNPFSFFKNDSNHVDFQLFRIKKQDLMTYVSAGLFALWFASFQNVIDLGPFQNISLGLSAGTAVSAGILYKQQKKS